MRKLFFYAIMLSVVLFFNSCTTSPICVTSSVTPLQGKVIAENLGKTEGKHTAVSIFGVYMIGRPDLDKAIKRALEKKGGDTLINVRCYETFGNFLVVTTNTVTVEGEAVKFVVETSRPKDKKR